MSIIFLHFNKDAVSFPRAYVFILMNSIISLGQQLIELKLHPDNATHYQSMQRAVPRGRTVHHHVQLQDRNLQA